jgi:RimJ/RimL family protein N-acetyltransferase
LAESNESKLTRAVEGRHRLRIVARMAGPHHDDLRPVRSPFQGGSVRLRAVEESDLAEINERFWDPDVNQFMALPWPEPVAGTRAWWEHRRASGEPTLAIETLAGELIGVCSLEQVNTRARTAWLGIWIAKGHWDRGYGTDALGLLCRFAFREMNLQRVSLAVYETNPRARRAYEKVGFKEEGRLRRAHFVGGRHVDTLIMGLLAEDLIES